MLVKRLRSRTPARLSVEDTLLERLAQDLEDMAAELGPFIQEAHAMVGQRLLARHRHVAPANQPRIRDGVVGRATWAGRDYRRAVAGEADDVLHAREGVDGPQQADHRSAVTFTLADGSGRSSTLVNISRENIA